MNFGIETSGFTYLLSELFKYNKIENYLYRLDLSRVFHVHSIYLFNVCL